jgi:transcriptional regulator with XRE-family HTH domain
MPKRSKNDCRNKDIGNRIRVARVRQGLSQIETAARLGITYPTLSKYQTGETALSATRLLDVAAALHVTIAWLVGESFSEADVDPPPSGTLDALMMAAFARIEDHAAQLEALRTAEALGAVRRTNKPTGEELSSRHNGTSVGVWTEISAAWTKGSVGQHARRPADPRGGIAEACLGGAATAMTG